MYYGNEFIEECFLNANPTVHRNYFGGFIINTGGMGLMGNCVHPLYDKNSQILEEKVRSIEYKLAVQGIVPLYRILIQSNYTKLDSILFSSNYEKIHSATVVATKVQGMKEELFKFADFNNHGIFIDENVGYGDRWIDDYIFLNNMSNEDQMAFLSALQLRTVPNVAVTLLQESTLMGQAFATIQDDIMIIDNIIINERYRQRGYGTKLLLSIMTFAIYKNVDVVIAQISQGDSISLKLFEKGRFMVLYNLFYRKYMGSMERLVKRGKNSLKFL